MGELEQVFYAAYVVPDQVRASPQSELLRLSRTNFSEAYQILTHLKVVRVFVESVLRYGLPAEYSAIVIKVSLLTSGLHPLA
jgi:hypothetical protein